MLFIVAISILVGIVITYDISKMRMADKAEFVNEGNITRYEWIEMLCTQTGITEYQSETPYFSDVKKDSTYYSHLQSAVEWEILDASADFDGENYAS